MVHSLLVAFYGTVQGTFVQTTSSTIKVFRRFPRPFVGLLHKFLASYALPPKEVNIYLVLYHPG